MRAKHSLFRLWPLFGYIVITLVVFGKTLIPPASQMLFADDAIRMYYFQKIFMKEALSGGMFPWWNPYLLSGIPFVEHPQVFFWYPLNILFFLFPISVAFSLFFVFHFILAMSTMYVFVRQWVRSLPAWTSGIVFGLSTYFTARIWAGHMYILSAAAWMPLVLWAFWRLFNTAPAQNRRKYIIAGGILAIQIFSGNPAVVLFTVEIIGFTALVYAISLRSWKPIIRTFFSILLGVGLSAIQLIPSSRYIAQSMRTLSLPYGWASVGSPTVAHLWELLHPFLFYRQLPQLALGHERAAFIGVTPLIFAIFVIVFAIIKKSKWKEIWIFLTLALFAIWVSLAGNAQIDLFSILWKFVPFYHQMRVPSRHLLIFVFSVSVLAAIGINRIKERLFLVAIAGIVLWELVPIGRKNIQLKILPEGLVDTKLVDILKTNQNDRIFPDFFHGDPLHDVFEFNAPSQYHIFSVSAHDVPPLRNYYEFLMAVNGLSVADIADFTETVPPFPNISSPYLNFLNIRYILVPLSSDAISRVRTNQFIMVDENKDRGYRVYENKNVLPRFYFVQNAIISSRQNIDRIIRQGNVDPRNTVLLEIPTRSLGSSCSNTQNSVFIKTYQSDKIIIDVQNPCDAYLVSSEVYYPGWRAYIDGKQTEIVEANLAFRAVFVPNGTHTITFSYVPHIVFIGAAISIIAIVVSLAHIL